MPEKFSNPHDKIIFNGPRDFSRLIGELALFQQDLYSSDIPDPQIRGHLVKNASIACGRMHRYLDHLKFRVAVNDISDANVSLYGPTGNVSAPILPSNEYDEETVDVSYRGVKVVDESFGWSTDIPGMKGSYKFSRMVHHLVVPIDAIEYRNDHKLYIDVAMPIEKGEQYLEQM